MTDPRSSLHFKAVRMLAASTVLWGASFVLVRALTMLLERLFPGSNSWFHAGFIGVGRFGIAAVVLLAMSARTMRQFTRSEIWQGAGLGFFAGGGILLQMDGLSYIDASTSAFLTQTFCVLVPILVAIRDRRFPGSRVIFSTVLLMIGVGILSNFNFHTLRLGRGELETLLGTVFFAGQILWLERPVFRGNNVNHFSFVMFLTMALISLPILAATTQRPGDFLIGILDGQVFVLMLLLIVLCTLGAFVLMNRWQPFVPSTEAAVIYGAEPVLASALALFVPALISQATGIDYGNERLTFSLVTGGALVVAANLLLQLRWVRGKPEVT